MPPNTLSIDVPLSAMIEPADLRILEAKPGAKAGNVPVEILARSTEVIDHWWYGPMVHDLDGLVGFKKTAIDYRHDDTAELGYVDEALTTPAGLVCRGFLVPFEGDPCAKIIKKSAGGVPYEASISYDDLAIEELQKNVTAEVNGGTITGPCRIVRQWKLRGLAICLYGADSNTETRLAADGGELTRKVNIMSVSADTPPVGSPAPAAETPVETPVETPTETPVETPTETPAADPNADAAQARRLEAAPFLKEFGAEKGPAYFAQGLTMPAARAEFLTAVTAERDAMQAERDELAKKIKAADLGDPEPLPAGDQAEAPPGGKLAHLPENIRRFAGALHRPTPAKTE